MRDGDRSPDVFTFADQANVDQTTAITSNTVTINGIDSGTAISIDVGEYSIGCAAAGFTGTAGTIDNGQTVCVRHTSANAPNSAVNSVLTVGTGSDTFTTGTVIQSNAITVSGIDAASSVSVTGGRYSIGCTAGMFTTSPGSVNNGDTVCVSHTSASAASTAVNTTLNVGGVPDTFTSTTRADGASDVDSVNNPDGQAVQIAISAAPSRIWSTTRIRQPGSRRRRTSLSPTVTSASISRG